MFSVLNRTDAVALGERIQAVEFDCPFRIDPEALTVTHADDVICTPSVEHDPTDDILIDGAPERDSEWWSISGMTGQYSYNGAVMHSSEFIGAAMADELVRIGEDDPRMVFVVTVVEVIDEETGEHEDEPAGWTILYRTGAL